MVRVSRKDAAARLKVSKSTLDRMIKLGEVATEKEQHGRRHTVWVLMDEIIEDTNEDFIGNTNDHLPGDTEHIRDDTGASEDFGGNTNGHLPGATEHTRDDTGASEDFGGNTNGHLPGATEHTRNDTGADEDTGRSANGHVPGASEHPAEAEVRVLQTEVNGLRELVDLYRERLADADWRYHEVLEQLKTTNNALPAAQGAGPRVKRWWWPFP